MPKHRVPLYEFERDPSKTYRNWNRRRILKQEIDHKRKMVGVHTCKDIKIFEAGCQRCVDLARIMQGLKNIDLGFYFAGEAMRRTNG